MATFLLLHGAGSDAWHWHRVVPLLEAAGHEAIAVDLPVADDSAGFGDYADVAVAALGDRSDVVVVAQSLGGFTAPLVADRVPVALLVLVAAMVPRPGESAGDWWANTGHDVAVRAAAAADGRDIDDGSDETIFLHDVPDAVIAASADHVVDQSGGPFADPWPLDRWPDVPTRVLLCRDDRFLPADLQRRLTQERLGLVADEMPGGHLPALARPDELAARLLAYADEVGLGGGDPPTGVR
jgi:pimeloyl-ACP methyl ester carboxylesterase